MTLPALLLSALLAGAQAAPASPPPPYAQPGEEKVEPYTPADANAAATPFAGDAMARAFHGQAGIRRIVNDLVGRNFADPVIGEIFRGHDKARLSRTLFEQFCFILNAGCSYTGRDMRTAHKDLGVQQADMNRLVEVLQAAMRDEHVSFAAQNRFLSKLAPMRGQVVER